MSTSTIETEKKATPGTKAVKYVYLFGDNHAEGHGKMKDDLGGKGAGLAEMTNAGLPVPPGFTIQTEACREYMRNRKTSAEVDKQMDEALARLEKLQGQKLGGAENPLLVSVRSGAKFSMPGMMDTILNLGLNDKSVEGLAKRSNNPRFAYDSYRRLIQMFGSVVLDIPKPAFEEVFDGKKKQKKSNAQGAKPRPSSMVDKYGVSHGRGARKTSVASVWVKPGNGTIVVNGRPHFEYFTRLHDRAMLLQPFLPGKIAGQFDAFVNVHGGGKSGKAQAVRHGLAHALQKYDINLRKGIKFAGLLTRDVRHKERKKPGRLKARKQPKWHRR